jgi:hypothetical protein
MTRFWLVEVRVWYSGHNGTRHIESQYLATKNPRWSLFKFQIVVLHQDSDWESKYRRSVDTNSWQMGVKSRQRHHLAAVYSHPERLVDESISFRMKERQLSRTELDPDSKSIGTNDAVVHAEEGFAPRNEHCCFNSRTPEKADFILNHVYLRILTARYSYLFSPHAWGFNRGENRQWFYPLYNSGSTWVYLLWFDTAWCFSLTFCAISLEAEF